MRISDAAVMGLLDPWVPGLACPNTSDAPSAQREIDVGAALSEFLEGSSGAADGEFA